MSLNVVLQYQAAQRTGGLIWKASREGGYTCFVFL